MLTYPAWRRQRQLRALLIAAALGGLAACASVLCRCAPTQPGANGLPANMHQVRPNVWRMAHPMGQQWDRLAERFAGKRVHVLHLAYPHEVIDGDYATADRARLLGWDVHELGMDPRTDPAGPIEFERERESRPDRGVVDELDRVVAGIPVVDNGVDVWLIFCIHGWDRTGYAVMRVRDVVDRWTFDRALREACDHGFHRIYIGLVTEARARWRAGKAP